MGQLDTSKRKYRQFRQNLREYVRRKISGEPSEDETDQDQPSPELAGQAKKQRADESPTTFRQRRGRLWAYTRLLSGHRRGLLLVFALAFIAAGAETIIPLGMGMIVDHVLQSDALDTPEQRRWLAIGCGTLLGLAVIGPLLDNARFVLIKIINVGLMSRLRQRLFSHLMRLPLRDLQEMKSGGIVARLGSDVDEVAGLVQMGVVSPVVALTRLGVATVILMSWNWRLGLVLVGVLLPFSFISLMWVKRGRPIWEAAHEQRSQVSGRVSESFTGVRVVRAFGREAREHRGYAVGHHTVARKQLLAYWLVAVVEGCWEMLMPLTSVVILWYGGVMLLSGQGATIGQIMAYSAYVGMLIFPIFMIVASLGQIQQAMAAMDRIFDTLEKPTDKPDPPDAVEAPRIVDRISLEAVSFAYEPDRPVLADLNLDVPGGSTVALVGPSGAGKTTLVDLIARFHDPTEGAIKLNGVDLRQIKLKSYRSLLALVEQEVFLFDGTVRDNIAYGNRHASDEQVHAAARRANAAGFIEKLPEGYDTLIGERGVKLSGGQRQRLSIARAILADPAVLILDEATSNLDSQSERLIQQALNELLKDRTTFVIAHRLSTITHADLIVVMESGRIVDTGRHEELMAHEGLYHQMVLRQRDAFDEPAYEQPGG